ncbi:hypothetical protein RJT34_01159 [Clitoria ternatea]|uniref:non-specific serine/threonine protein kinase n=1 Tax=Clitoria ternatea TaxID=43366 RepID=A0AAN9Q148_CLITE
MLMMQKRRRTTLCPFFFFLGMGVAVAQSVSFDFPSFTFNNTNITLLGDSYLRNGVVGLTTPIENLPTSSIGAFFYNNPISLNTTSSFSTTFTFSINNNNNNNPTSSGDGLAFFLSPDNLSLSLPLPHPLGLPSTFLAVEFDTRLDPPFHDPNDNHVGLNIDTLHSLKTEDPMLQNIDLKSGNPITAWIHYSINHNLLSVFLSYSSSKPPQPLLSVRVDLSQHLTRPLYIGFSASTNESTEFHHIFSWSFSSTLQDFLHPHNVSDNSITVTFPDNNVKHDKKVGIGVVVVGPVFFFAAFVFSILGYVFLVRKWKGVGNEEEFEGEIVACPRAFDYKELKSATREFHPSRIVGHGSFGTVYKALFISSGTIAAVKRSRHSHEGKMEFLAELFIIAGLRHKNLVQLQGWCVEKGELLLVYDFMPNGSLDRVLYKEPEKGKLLSWSHRVNIVLGLASVLVYLHQECEQRVIHRDIKTGNVLLDGNLNPRLGDFGLAKLMDHDKSPVSTLTAGTMGYLAPEYIQYGKATDKTDVFSYGVVMLEVACGRKPIEREGSKMVNLIDWVWGLHSEGRIIEAADKRLNGEFEEEEMRKLLLLGLSCANPDSAERPSMRRVLQILNKEAASLVVPKVKPSLTFSSDLPLTIDEIVSDAEEFNTSQSMCEIKIH